MIVLGIESTAHTFGVGIVTDKGEILANVRKPHTTKKGGIHPVEASEHHVQSAAPALREALEQAGLTIDQVDVIAYAGSPGLGPCLRVGNFLARLLALKHNKPLVSVNHSVAHLEIGRLLSGYDDPVLLYVSGVNTQIICFEGGKYRIMGETLDMGVGNLIDKFARELGLGFPGGPQIQEKAKEGNQLIELPYSIKGMDLSLGGLHTHLKRLAEKNAFSTEDLCYSLQETVFAMLVEATERALAQTGKTELVLGGGVACNTRLQEMCQKMCEARQAKCFTPKNELLVDNAAMIAWLGVLKVQKEQFVDPQTAALDPYERTDQVEVVWR